VTIDHRSPSSLVRRNLLAVYIGAFFAALGFSLVTPLMPLLVLELLGGSPSMSSGQSLAQAGLWAGIAIGIAPLLTALTGPWWGSLGDRVGQKKMIQRALVSIGIAVGFTSIITQPWQLVGLRGVIGVLGGISVASLAAVTATSGKQALGRNIGFLQAAQTLGFVAGPLVGGGLAMAAGMRPAFAISTTLFALAFALVTWLYRDLPRPSPTVDSGAPAHKPDSARLAGSFLFWATLTVLFSANFLDGSFMVMLPLYLPMLGAPSDSVALLAGLGLSGGALAMAISAALIGRLTSRLPTGTLVLALLGASALTLIGIILATTWWQFLALRVLLGLLAGGLPTLGYAAATGLAPPARSGAVVGIASSAGLLGWAIAPALVGLLVGLDPRAVFAMDLFLIVACGAAYSWAGGIPKLRTLPAAARERLASPSR
jgi:DHA1 family multidrug resistance protein-like MFS transporter